MLGRAVRYAEGQEPLNARLGRQTPVVEHRRRGAVLLGCCAQPAAARRSGAGATFVFIARGFSNWGWLRIDRLQPPSVAGPQAACGATTDGVADPGAASSIARNGADQRRPPRRREPLPRAARVLRHSMVAHSLAGEGHNPEMGNIAHIDHRLTPALRQGSSLLHQARERSETAPRIYGGGARMAIGGAGRCSSEALRGCRL
jgi:hypothetical protein